ncbi:MAG: bifunctional phosphopantothenoylcysteine decarboxylase/phosphopantothenate--cysteine ligase CoaBC [Pseudomonadota bacterium]
MRSAIAGKNIVLGVCGGIAAYKSVELLRLLIKESASVWVMMTQNARRFVGPVTFEALSGHPVCSDLFNSRDESAMKHIRWAETADAVVIAPATANMIGKIAGGIGDDALSTFVLAVTSPVLVCPSMNSNMYQSAAVQRNLGILKNDGFFIIEPGSGELACKTVGPGRLPEPPYILDRLIRCISPKDLTGNRILVTAGPTREPVDPVRFISNPSSGKMGFAVARAAEHRGAEVILITGPSSLPDLPNVRTIRVNTAKEMADAVFAHMESSRIIIKTAAVSDYRPSRTSEQKMKKGTDALILHLEPTQDILMEIGRRKKNQVIVGFAAETDDLEKNAIDKLTRKHLDMIAANRIGCNGSGFESDTNQVTLFYKDGTREAVPIMEKAELAHLILDRITRMMQG